MSYAEVLEVADDDQVAPPANSNGWHGRVSIESATTPVSPEYKVVVNADGSLNLKLTMEYALWCAQGRPPDRRDVTAAHFQTADGAIRHAYVLYELTSLFAHTVEVAANGDVQELSTSTDFRVDVLPKPIIGVAIAQDAGRTPEGHDDPHKGHAMPVMFRAGDTIPEDRWMLVSTTVNADPGTAGMVGAVAATALKLLGASGQSQAAAATGLKISDAVEKVHARYLASQEFRVTMTRDLKNATWMLVANHIVRELTGGHNCITAELGDPQSPSYKSLLVAGAERAGLSDFALRHGHDYWHCLTDASLKAIVYSLAGIEGHLFKITRYVRLAGEVIENKLIHKVVDVGDAARDRLPVGTLGIAALVLGLKLIRSMIEEIAYKVNMTDSSKIILALNALDISVAEVKLERSVLLAIRNSMQSLIITAVGFMSGSPAGRDQVERFASLMSFAKRDAAANARGVGIAKVLRELDVNPEGVAVAIAGLLGSIAEGLNAAHDARAFIVQRLPTDYACVVPKSATQLRDEAQRDEAKAQTELAIARARSAQPGAGP